MSVNVEVKNRKVFRSVTFLVLIGDDIGVLNKRKMILGKRKGGVEVVVGLRMRLPRGQKVSVGLIQGWLHHHEFLPNVCRCQFSMDIFQPNC